MNKASESLAADLFRPLNAQFYYPLFCQLRDQLCLQLYAQMFDPPLDPYGHPFHAQLHYELMDQVRKDLR